MPDNPFENKAKQKLDELQFIPSDAVWQKVEARIKKDKDRRRLLIWLPLVCLLLGMGGWYLVSRSSASYPAKEIVALHVAENKPDTKHPDLKKRSSGAPAENKNQNDAVIRSVPLKETAVAPQSGNADGILKETEQIRSGNRFNHKLPADKEHQENDHADLSAGQKGAWHDARVPAQIAATNPVPGNTENNKAGIGSHAKAAANDENSIPNIDIANAPAPEKTDAVVQKSPPDSGSLRLENGKSPADKKKDSGKKNKITWSIATGAGLSFVSTKFTSNAYASASPNAGGPISGPALPSDRQSLSGFAGLQLEEPLNKTTSVFAGIQYAYSAIKITRGNQVNLPLPLNSLNYSYSYLTGYYAPSTSGDFNYTSHYHFLEIPLGLEKQLGKKSRFSVNAGFSVAWLFATNALQFDPLSKIYFKDDSYFNRVQWNVLGGMQYSLLRKEKYTLKIGPQVRYGLTSLLNNRSFYSAHLFSGEVRLLLIRNRK